MEKCDIDLLVADDSTKPTLGRIDNILIKLHMTFIRVNFIFMDMRRNTSSPIILGRPFLRIKGVVLILRKEMSSSNSHIRSVWSTFQGRK
jgi:hypothetical protein